MKKNEKILVTGSYGFLAQNLIKYLLKKNYEVVGIDCKKTDQSVFDFTEYINKKKFILLTIDIRDNKGIKNLLNKFSFNACFHLAAITQVNQSNKFPKQTFDTNINGTINLLENFQPLSMSFEDLPVEETMRSFFKNPEKYLK